MAIPAAHCSNPRFTWASLSTAEKSSAASSAATAQRGSGETLELRAHIVKMDGRSNGKLDATFVQDIFLEWREKTKCCSRNVGSGPQWADGFEACG
jgi:hypothetical protein